jgi:hypothetical protein
VAAHLYILDQDPYARRGSEVHAQPQKGVLP